LEFPFGGAWVPLDPTVRIFLGYSQPKHFIECWVCIVFMDSFAARKRVAINAGIDTVCLVALTAAVTIEVRNDAGEVRQQAAAAALQGFAEGLQELMLGATSTCIPPAFAGRGAEP
jgi:hypothetical protein